MSNVQDKQKSYKICVLPGDGIGPEIMDEAIKVLDALAKTTDMTFEYERALIGGCALDATDCQTALPDETIACAQSSDAVLLGAVGGPKWDTTDPNKARPEQGLLGIRKALNLYINLRPVKVFSALIDASTLKKEFLEGVDLLMVRELTGGLYFGERQRECEVADAFAPGTPGMRAYDTMIYTEHEIERIVRWAFEAAQHRSKKVHSIDKANVLESSRLWREVTHRVAQDYPDIELIDQLVDNTAMQLIRYPKQFDVVVTENMFGDILSDEASMLTGSLGMLASASLGDGVALYEPSHGSAPDIAGLGIANPLAQILSVSLMLRYSFNRHNEADKIDKAIDQLLTEGYRTKDIADADTPVEFVLNTQEMGDKVVLYL